MIALDMYNAALNDIHQYFGYEPEWHVFPIEDCREYYWRINDDEVVFGYSKGDVKNRNFAERIIQVYPAVHPDNAYTMIKVDTETDGNKFLSIFDNAKRIL